MYSGYVVPLLLVLVFCTVITFMYVKPGVHANHDQVSSSSYELRRDKGVYGDTNDEDKDDDDNAYSERLNYIETQLSQERKHNENTDSQLKALVVEIEAERARNNKLLLDRKSERDIDTQRLEYLELQLNLRNEEKAKSENELKLLKDKLEVERRAYEQQLIERESQIRQRQELKHQQEEAQRQLELKRKDEEEKLRRQQQELQRQLELQRQRESERADELRRQQQLHRQQQESQRQLELQRQRDSERADEFRRKQQLLQQQELQRQLELQRRREPERADELRRQQQEPQRQLELRRQQESLRQQQLQLQRESERADELRRQQKPQQQQEESQRQLELQRQRESERAEELRRLQERRQTQTPQSEQLRPVQSQPTDSRVIATVKSPLSIDNAAVVKTPPPPPAPASQPNSEKTDPSLMPPAKIEVPNAPATNEIVPIEKRFVKHTEVPHNKSWVDVSKLTIVITPEMSDAIAKSIGTSKLANRYCVIKIPESAIPPGSSTERKLKKCLVVGENKDGVPKRYARMKIILSPDTAPSMIFYDYTPVVLHKVCYDFEQNTVSDREGCTWQEFEVTTVHLGTEKLAKISRVSLLLKPDKSKSQPDNKKPNKGKSKGKKKNTK